MRFYLERPHTERYSVSLRIQFKCRKRRTRKTQNTDTFHAVNVIKNLNGTENAIDQNKFAYEVFIDLKKPCDTFNYEVLLIKLWHYGIKGTANGCIKSYLTNRMPYVSIEELLSDLLSAKYGVPQVSVLHFLFSVST